MGTIQHILLCALAVGNLSNISAAQSDGEIVDSSCVGAEMGATCQPENQCAHGVCMMDECLEAPANDGETCALDNGTQGVCASEDGGAGLTCVAPPPPEVASPIVTTTANPNDETPVAITKAAAESDPRATAAPVVVVTDAPVDTPQRVTDTETEQLELPKTNITSDGVNLAEVAAELADEITWNPSLLPDAQTDDVVFTVSIFIEGAVDAGLWVVSMSSGYPAVILSRAGEDSIAALSDYISRNTIFTPQEFVLVPVNPRGTVIPADQVIRFCLLKRQCRASERDALLQLLMDTSRMEIAFASQPSLSSTTGVAIIEIGETPVTKGVINSDDPADASRSNIVMILGFTMAFLIIAAGIIAYQRLKLINEDFDILPLPATSSTGGVKRDATMTEKRAESILFRSEAAPSADNFVISRLPFNIMKNRFEHHLPYDHTRIELTESNGAPGSDYINASLIPGNKETTYIATQAPISRTVQDFWRMVCEQGCKTIVMMTLAREDGVEHSYQYWPHLTGEDHAITFGDVTLTTTALDLTEDHAVRTISITVADRPKYMAQKYAGQKITVNHFLFFGFPDKSTPVNTKPFRTFREKVTVASKGQSGPTLVHCNNGSGRTGVYICYDMTMARYDECGEADLFESLVTMRRNRPQMVESRAQYLFLHRSFVDQLLEGPLQMLGTQSSQHTEFLKPFAVPHDLAPFDIGVPGRKILYLGDVQLVNAKGNRYAAATLAITSDLVVLCSMQDNQQVLQGFADRKVIAESLFEKVNRGDPLCFAVVMDNLYVLAASDAAAKADWVRRLTNVDNYVAPQNLKGDRMTTFRPTSRSAALAILQCADPQVENGALALKKEYDTIPRAFSVGPRTVMKGIKETQGKTGYLVNPMGPKTANNPIVGAPGGDSSIFFSSPAKLNLDGTYIGGPPPTMLDLSTMSEAPHYSDGHVGRPTAMSMGGKVLFPGFAHKAAINTEAVLANKLSELETAIQRADELNIIASGNPGKYLADSVMQPPGHCGAPRRVDESMLNETKLDETRLAGSTSSQFTNAHRAQLWELFSEFENVTKNLDVEELKALLSEFGLFPENDGDALLQQTMKEVGPMIEVDDFEATFLARQRLRAGNFKRVVPVPGFSQKATNQSNFAGHWFSEELRHDLHELFGEGKPHGVEHKFEFEILVNMLREGDLLDQLESDAGDGESGLLALCKSMARDVSGRIRVDDFERKFMSTAGRKRQTSSRSNSPVRSVSPVQMSRRASVESNQETFSLTSTPRKGNHQSYIEIGNEEAETSYFGPAGNQAEAVAVSGQGSSRPDSTVEVGQPSKALSSSISRQDLAETALPRRVDSHHVENILGQRAFSIPALALKSLHAKRTKGGYKDADDVFTVQKGARKRMIRNPTLRAKGANYKARASILDECTHLGNCQCAKCAAEHESAL
jgi:protein tyrosine phosphatase